MTRSPASRQRAERRRIQREAGVKFPYVFTAHARPDGHFGRKCRIIGKGKVPEVVWVEFDGGGKYWVARRSLARS